MHERGAQALRGALAKSRLRKESAGAIRQAELARRWQQHDSATIGSRPKHLLAERLEFFSNSIERAMDGSLGATDLPADFRNRVSLKA